MELSHPILQSKNSNILIKFETDKKIEIYSKDKNIHKNQLIWDSFLEFILYDSEVEKYMR